MVTVNKHSNTGWIFLLHHPWGTNCPLKEVKLWKLAYGWAPQNRRKTPQNGGCFIMENPIKMDDLGVGTIIFWKHPYTLEDSPLATEIMRQSHEGMDQLFKLMFRSTQAKQMTKLRPCWEWCLKHYASPIFQQVVLILENRISAIFHPKTSW